MDKNLIARHTECGQRAHDATKYTVFIPDVPFLQIFYIVSGLLPVDD